MPAWGTDKVTSRINKPEIPSAIAIHSDRLFFFFKLDNNQNKLSFTWLLSLLAFTFFFFFYMVITSGTNLQVTGYVTNTCGLCLNTRHNETDNQYDCFIYLFIFTRKRYFILIRICICNNCVLAVIFVGEPSDGFEV